MKCGFCRGVTAVLNNRQLLFVLGGALLILSCAITNSAAPPRKAQAISAKNVFEAEERLSILGYWAGPVDEVFDSRSRHALIAFQKVEGRKRTGELTKVELEALRIATRPIPLHTGGTHVEIDIQRQVLFLVDDQDTVSHILPVSSGNEGSYMDHGQAHRAHTPRGEFKILRKIAGPRISSLGFLYYPNYLHAGIAIHGSWSIPIHPASHGCIRIPMFAAKEFSYLVPVGTRVIIY